MMQIDVRRTLAVVVGLAMVAGIAYLLVSDPDTEFAPPAPPADADAAPATAAPTPSQEPEQPPELNNRGHDFDAIWRSIVAYRNWIYGSDPKVSLLSAIYERACTCFQPEAGLLRRLSRQGWRYNDDGMSVLSVEIVDRPTKDGVVLEVVDEHGRQLVIDQAGQTVKAGAGWPPTRRLVVLHRGGDGKWRVDASRELGPASAS